MSIHIDLMQEPKQEKSSSLAEILFIFLRLGFTSFGGPTAHLGFFRETFVNKRQWMTDAEYADLVALCQFLPGPASSQVGYAVGLRRGGWLGGMAAWLGFTAPSALALTLFGMGIAKFGDIENNGGWLRGLQIAVVAVIAKALWGMARSLCPDRMRAAFAILSAMLVLAFPGAWAQVAVIVLGGIAGLLFLRKLQTAQPVAVVSDSPGKKGRHLASVACLVTFFALLLGLPIIEKATDAPVLDAFSSFYQTGSLVFGGGHVVLPLLQVETVAPGWVTEQEFLAGYGAAQAVPGPLFTFSAYLGSVMNFGPGQLSMAGICLVATFLPSWLMVAGVLPFWEKLRAIPKLRLALAGTNAAVVGLLAAALYSPTWTAAIESRWDIIFLAGIALLFFVVRLPVWALVIVAAMSGWLLL